MRRVWSYVLMILLPAVAQAASIGLAWDPPVSAPDLAGYRLYQCSQSGCTPSFKRDVGLVLSVIEGDLAAGTLYRFQVTAYDTSGYESSRSNLLELMSPAGPPPPAPSPALVQVNFQPTGAPTPQGYQADDGAPYGTTRGYGWNVDLRGWSRDRDVHADQRLDTFVFTVSPARWSYNVPNGNYLISLASGDPTNGQGPHLVKVENQTLINNVVTQPNQFATITDRPVTIADGQLTIDIGGTSGHTMLNYVMLRPAQALLPGPSSNMRLSIQVVP